MFQALLEKYMRIITACITTVETHSDTNEVLAPFADNRPQDRCHGRRRDDRQLRLRHQHVGRNVFPK